MTSETDIVNAALRRVGGKRISAITDMVGTAGIARDIYEAERDSLLASGTWSFSTVRAELIPLALEVPAFGFDHAFVQPADLMRMISVYDDNEANTETTYKLESIQKADNTYVAVILCDADIIWIKYVRQVTEIDLMSKAPLFIDALILSLAQVFAIGVAKSNELYKAIDEDLKATLRKARSIDGIQNQIDQLSEGSWARSRRGRGWASAWSPDWPK